MRTLTLSSIATLLVLSACASEPEHRETPPVLQKQIDTIVGRLGSQRGQALWDDMRRLSSYGAFAVPSLIEALESSDNPRLRGSAAFVLGDIDDERSLAALDDALDDSDALVKFEAARSLLHLGSWQGIPVLIDGLGSEDPKIRYHCHEALRNQTLKDFGFAVDDQPAQRAAAIEKWENWWESFEDSRS